MRRENIITLSAIESSDLPIPSLLFHFLAALPSKKSVSASGIMISDRFFMLNGVNKGRTKSTKGAVNLEQVRILAMWRFFMPMSFSPPFYFFKKLTLYNAMGERLCQPR